MKLPAIRLIIGLCLPELIADVLFNPPAPSLNVTSLPLSLSPSLLPLYSLGRAGGSMISSTEEQPCRQRLMYRRHGCRFTPKVMDIHSYVGT
jgi:hypothetical protein